MKTYKLSDPTVNNILAFLDRVEFKGLTEAQVLNQIIMELHNPIQEVEEKLVSE